MLIIHLAAVLWLSLFGLCFLLWKDGEKKEAWAPILLFAAAFLLRLSAAGFSRGFDNDTACFAAWAERIVQLGPGGFYSDGVFTDYPPGYIYLLYPVGLLRNLLGAEYGSALHLALLKLPAVLCDMACGVILYREAGRRLDGLKPLLLTAAYLFNPAVLLNSSVWGQVDSVYTLLASLMALGLIRERHILGPLACFCLGVLIKPQMLLLAPALLAGIINYLFRKSSDSPGRRLLRCLGSGLVCLLGLLLLILPFGLENVFSQYFTTVGSYPYAAVNACNLWGLLGLNWVSQDNTFLGLPYRIYGYAAVAAAAVFCLFLGLKQPGAGSAEERPGGMPKTNYPLLAALFTATVFVLSVRMHERYLYPAVVLLLFACIYRPSGRLFFCYGGFSLLHFYNTAHVLFFYDPKNYDRREPLILFVSAGMIILLILLWTEIPGAFFRRGRDADASFPSLALPPAPSRPCSRLKRVDYLLITGITLLYSCFALYDLGGLHSPSTALRMSSGESIRIKFQEESDKRPLRFAYYMAPREKRSFTVSAGESREEVVFKNVFTWQIENLPDVPLGTDEITLTLESREASLLELVFLDEYGNILTPANAGDYPALFDEQDLYPKEISFRNGMYFDEIYHGRTAYEFLHGLTAYENTHPPLGKLFIAGGIAVFGMNPFGWRIVGTLFGIAMVPLVYLFAKGLTGSTPLGALGCFLFSFDFMHFTQSRIATIDVYVTFFVIAMYYFMYRFVRLSFYDTPLKRLFLPLGLCGVCMGLGISCKWSGVYAGIGLAVIFFGVMLRRYREYLYAKEDPRGSTAGISHEVIRSSFSPCLLRTLVFCVLCFVMIPGLIYLLSYLPFQDGTADGLVLRMLRNQKTMFDYHSTLNATHAYSSPWYQWPVMYRPIWYYSRVVTGAQDAGGLREGISAFGNPLVWWVGIPAALFTLICRIRASLPRRRNTAPALYAAQKQDSAAALFLLTGYLAQYLPWFFVTRITFIYHYFPSVVFVVLMIVFCLNKLGRRLSSGSFLLLLSLYGAAALGLFLLFYPVLSGRPVEAAYVNTFLRWLKSWVLAVR